MKYYFFSLFLCFVLNLQAQIITKAYTDSLSEITVQLPQDWALIRNLYPSYEFENCIQSSIFVTLDGMSAAIVDYSAGCVITKDSDVSKKGVENAIVEMMPEESTIKEKPKKEKIRTYNPKQFLKSSHKAYLAAFETDYNGKSANLAAIKNTKIAIGKYKGLFSEFLYDHESVEFTGRYHTYLLTLMQGNKRVQIIMEADEKKWDTYKSTFDAALQSLQLK